MKISTLTFYTLTLFPCIVYRLLFVSSFELFPHFPKSYNIKIQKLPENSKLSKTHGKTSCFRNYTRFLCCITLISSSPIFGSVTFLHKVIKVWSTKVSCCMETHWIPQYSQFITKPMEKSLFWIYHSCGLWIDHFQLAKIFWNNFCARSSV